VIPRRSDLAGFTLIELIVSLTITGAVLSAGFAAFRTVLDRRDVAASMLDEVNRAAGERALLQSWIEAARLPLQGEPAFAGLDAQSGKLPDDNITLLTAAATDLDGAEAIVRLAVDRDERTPERGLVAHLTSWPAGEQRTVEIDPRVTGLELRYYSVPLGDRGWLPSWVSSTILPSGVEITLVGDSLPPLLRLPLLVPVGGVQ
jgi:prepilin-type N-terminal cleavage/methylation domain-containing protein